MSANATLEGGNSLEHRCFKAIGSTVFKYRWPVFIFGHLVLIGLSLGLMDIKVQTEVSELWIETGSRLRDEIDLVKNRFGTGTRTELVAFRNKDNSQTAVTAALLTEALSLMYPLLVENTLARPNFLSNNNTAEPAFYVEADPRLQLQYTFPGQVAPATATGGANANFRFTQIQLCERPPVPAVYKPVRAYHKGALQVGQSMSDANAQRLAYIVAKAFASHGYNKMMQCIKTKALNANFSIASFFANAPTGHAGVLDLNANQARPGRGFSDFDMFYGGLPTQLGFDAFAVLNSPSPQFPKNGPPAKAPISWGIQRLPCTRLTVLDCFQEGGFDYPRDLAVIDGFGQIAYIVDKKLEVTVGTSNVSVLTDSLLLPTILGTVNKVNQAYMAGAFNPVLAPAGWSAANLSNFDSSNLATKMFLIGTMTEPLRKRVEGYNDACRTDVQTEIVGDFLFWNSIINTSLPGWAGTAPVGAADYMAAAAAATSAGGIEFLGGIGYSWRKKLSAMTSPTKFVYNSVVSSRQGVSAETCISQTQAQASDDSAVSCCPVWAPTLVPDNLWLASGSSATNIPTHRLVMNNFGEGTPQLGLDIMENLNGPNAALGVTTDRALATTPTQAEQETLVVAFENKMKDYLNPFWERKSTTACKAAFYDSNTDCTTKSNQVYYLLSISVDDIVKEASEPSAVLVIAGYVILIVYTTAAVARTPCVYSRASLGLMAIYYVAISVIASFGLTALFKDLDPLSNNLVPFLGLGLGMDDAYVMIQTTTLMTKYSDNPQKRMEEVMVVAGPSVTLTSVTVSISFFVASLTPIPAVQAFVIQMGCCVALNLFGLLTIFSAVVAMDAQRVTDKRKDILCCEQFKDENVEEEATAVDLSGGPVNTCMSKFCVPCLKSVPGKIAVLLGFTILFVVLAVLAFTEVNEGFLISDIALKGSYQRDYVKLQETYYGVYSNSLYTLSSQDTSSRWDPLIAEFGTAAVCASPTNPLNASEANPFPACSTTATVDPLACVGTACKQNVQRSMLAKLGTLDTVLKVDVANKGPLTNWLGTGTTSIMGFKATLPQQAGLATIARLTGTATGQTASETSLWADKFHTIPPYVFGGVFESWVTAFGATSLNDMVCAPRANPTAFKSCDGYKASTDFLEAVKTSVYTKPLVTDSDYIDVIEEGRDAIDGIDPEYSFMGGYIFNYWDQYVGIQRKLLTIVGWALLGTFLSTLILQFSPFTSLLVCLVILKVVIECYGFIYVLDIKLNAFSLVNLVIACGLAVEFTAHISHVFLMAKGSKNERMEFALMEMMAPMVNGMLSSFLAVIALAFAEFPFFRLYYFGMFSFMIIIAFLEGMVFLPVVLSLIGPAEFSTAMSPPGAVGMKPLESRQDGTFEDDTTAV